MRFKISTTDNGKHSDMKFAVNCAQDLVEDSARLSGQDAIEMRKLENQLVEILEPYFRAIADREMAGIETKSHEWLAEPLKAEPGIVAMMEEAVLAAYKASAFGGDMDAMWPDPAFSRTITERDQNGIGIRQSVVSDVMIRREDLMKRTIYRVIERDVRDAQHMHRDWFAGSGMVGHHTDLTKHPGHDPKNEHIVRWFDLHAAKDPETFRRAFHEHATGEKLPPTKASA